MPPRLRSAAQEAAADAVVPAAAVAAVVASVSDLPPDVVDNVFSFLAGDVASLCVAACVQRSWHAATLRPALWRDLRFSDHFGVAERLTDTHFEWLIRRAGAALRCLDLAHCGNYLAYNCGVTLRGVVNALRDAPLLKQLSLRGVPYGTRDNGPRVRRYEQLSVLVCPDNGLLDAVDYDGELVMCDAYLDDGILCQRLCSADDEICEECAIFHCPGCLGAALLELKPPCEHLCDTCFAHEDQADGDFFAACDNAHCAADRVNGNCVKCSPMCDACQKILCNDCAHNKHGMLMCRSFCAELQYCEDCVYPAVRPSRWPREEERKLIHCAGCQEMVCPRCMDLQDESFCGLCDKEFCGSCRVKPSVLIPRRGLQQVCKACAKTVGLAR